MNRNALIVLAVVLFLVLVGLAWAVMRPSMPSQTATTTPTGMTETPTPTPDAPNDTASTTLIIVDAPAPNQKVTSPLTVTGEARGSWYFEASFPVEVRNASGTVIAQGPAQAQGEWMTTNFVPFKATLTFPTQPAGSKGTVVFKKDNPSGDPARDAQIVVPITF